MSNRQPIIAGNWKMHKTLSEATEFIRALAPALAEYDGVERVVCPPTISLATVSKALQSSDIGVGAQNMHWEESGAYTSQTSPTMIAEIASYVILGHSEVRAYLNETDERVNKKAKAALAHGLKPIIAVGESLEQNEAGETESFVNGQVRGALDGITAEQMADVIIAYEPIWAIGTGRSASGEVANNIIGGVVRAALKDLYGEDVAQSVRIQYGGSVKPNNVVEYMQQPDIDGALVGGACLQVESFAAIIEAANNEAKAS